MTYEEVAKMYLTPHELGQWYHNVGDDEYIKKTIGNHDDMDDVVNLFQWEQTPEGYDYWEAVYTRVERGELPKEVLVPTRSMLRVSFV